MPTGRTTLRLSDERKQLLEGATGIIADGLDDPPRSDVIDTALTHLVESERISGTLATSTRRM